MSKKQRRKAEDVMQNLCNRLVYQQERKYVKGEYDLWEN